MTTTLDLLRPGQQGRVAALDGPPALLQRLMELGVFEGEEVEYVATAPFGDPLELQVGGTRLSLRRAEARCVSVSLP